jgi:hypothetical protein
MTAIDERDTLQMIELLSRDVKPVRRLAPPWRRALGWLVGIAVSFTAAAVLLGNPDDVATRARDPMMLASVIGAALTGILSVIAAFHLSLPDRPLTWALLPLPALVVWIAASGIGCLEHWGEMPPEMGNHWWSIGESAACFRFILLIGIPTGAALLFALRRARPIRPLPVTLIGGLAAASLAASLLVFFHPFDVALLDLAVHAVAIMVVIGVLTASRRLLGR